VNPNPTKAISFSNVFAFALFWIFSIHFWILNVVLNLSGNLKKVNWAWATALLFFP